MLLVACAVVFELCLAAVLWRLARERPSIATEIASIFIGFAGACSLGLATQGFFLFGANIIQASGLAPTLFWLTSGVFAFAVALALRPSPASASIPCTVVGALAFGYGIVRQDQLAPVVGAVLIFAAMVMWAIARWIVRRPSGAAACSQNGARPVGTTERAQ